MNQWAQLSGGYPGRRNGDTVSPSHLQPSQPPWSLPASSDTATYGYHNSLSQDLAGGTLRQPLASDIPISDTTSNRFELSYSEDASNLSLQPELQSSTGGGFHQATSRPPHHSFSNADQNALQASGPSQNSLNSTSFEPIHTHLSSGAHGTYYDEGHRPTNREPEAVFDRLGRTRDVDNKVPRFSPYEVLNPSLPPRSRRPAKILQIPSSVIDNVKKDTSRHMTTALFDRSLLPSVRQIEEWAKSALDDAAAVQVDNKEELAAWKLMKEGQTVISQLKGTLKRLHTKSRDYAEGFVTGGYDLSFDMTTDGTAAAKSRQTYSCFLLSNDDFLDKFIQRIAANGQLEWFRAPFANISVTGMVEFMLVNQQFRHHVAFNSPNWELRLMNVIALAGTICRWVVSRYSVNGWFKAAELYTLANETYYTYLITRMTLLSGTEEMLFRELLLNICSALLTLPVF